MEKICLDFEAALDFLRGEQSTVEKLKYYANQEEICLGSFTLIHLLETIKKPDVVMAFADSVTVLPFDRREATIAAKLKAEFEKKGTYRRGVDSLMTAATCLSNNAFLFTRNPGKFEGIKGLRRV
ncbi:MAG: hypothetical protein ABII71_06360 [Candidatus Micrarchaeota archaeon]